MSEFCPHCMSEINNPGKICPVCNKEINIRNLSHQLPTMTILSGRYLVGAVIGEGGFGITYVGLDLKLRVKVAIKEFYPSGIASRVNTQSTVIISFTQDGKRIITEGREKFYIEAQTAAKFSDEGGIVNVTDFFYENETAYMVMEYVEGIDLNHYIKKNGPIRDFNTLYTMIRPMMVSLGKIHEAGIIHRDISPSNIMLKMDGCVKLFDFGTAREINIDGEKSLSVVLKHGFAPPEQYTRHGAQGPWTDVYAMCATLYKLMSGVTPESSSDRILSNKKPESLEKYGVNITASQQEILFHGMELDINDRISSIPELISAFDSGVYKKSFKKKLKKIFSGKKFKIAASSAAVLAASAAAVITFAGNKNVQTEVEIIPSAEPAAEVTAEPTPTPTPIPTATPFPYIDDFHAEDYPAYRQTVTANNGDLVLGVKKDGTVIENKEQDQVVQYYSNEDVKEWSDIVNVGFNNKVIAGIKEDGTVVYAGKEESYLKKLSDWTDVKEIAVRGTNVIALKNDGTLLTAGTSEAGALNVSGWTDVETMVAAASYTAGLKSDGTVALAGKPWEDEYGYDYYDGHFSTSDWENIVYIWGTECYLAGICSDGTVRVTGMVDNSDDKYDSYVIDVSDWSNVKALCGSNEELIGITDDGNLLTTSKNSYSYRYWGDLKYICSFTYKYSRELSVYGLTDDGQVMSWNVKSNTAFEYVDSFENITSICASSGTVCGIDELGTLHVGGYGGNGFDALDGKENVRSIKTNGYVLAAVGNDGKIELSDINEYNTLTPVSQWRKIVAVSTDGTEYDATTVLGLVENGEVVAHSYDYDPYNIASATKWRNIKSISAGNGFALGLRYDGSVVAVGNNGYGQCNVEGFTDVAQIAAGYNNAGVLFNDGTVYASGSGTYNTGNWSDITQIACGQHVIAGVKKDGTVVCAHAYESSGDTSYKDWTDIVKVGFSGSAMDSIVALKSDGTLLTNDEEISVEGYSHVVDFCTSWGSITLLKDDGSVCSFSYYSSLDTDKLKDIRIPENISCEG